MLVAVNRHSGGSAAGVPGDQPVRRWVSEWLQENLFQRRIILLTGQLDESVANETAALLMSLEAVSDEAVDLYVDSFDGTLEAAFVVIDTLDALRVNVPVHCRGQVGGAVIGIVAAGDRRSAVPTHDSGLGSPLRGSRERRNRSARKAATSRPSCGDSTCVWDKSRVGLQRRLPKTYGVDGISMLPKRSIMDSSRRLLPRTDGRRSASPVHLPARFA
jgi:hypothetical protein